ncbi:MAG: LysM peptidoglycan-binding domain-containing protein [Chitinophagales bacterium]|nr:LysM peptidoglycan-binding domain-containing protein [Chitinophagales bacterium]
MRIFLVMFIFLGLNNVLAQDKMSNEEYVARFYPIAVRKMQEYRIPASITLAQGILESGSGNSNLALKANNHFGIKCHSEWQGEGYYMDDDEANECFRVYNNPEQSFADHSEFLTTRARYKFLFEDYPVDDYKSWAKGLKTAGYATNPDYPNLLISIIERLNLAQYDKMGLVEIKASPEMIAENTGELESKEWDVILPKNAYYTDDRSDVFIFNKIRTVKSKGRQALAIATEYDIDLDLLMKYNDIKEGYLFTPNQFVYLQPKRKKGSEKTHVVKAGETMWDISQLYGIQMDKLYKKNNMVFDKQPKPGEIVYLQSSRDGAPSFYSYMDVLLERKKLKEEQEAKEKAAIDAQKVIELEELKKKQAVLEAQIAAQKKQEEALKKEIEEMKKQEALKKVEEDAAKKEKQVFDAEQAPPLKLTPLTPVVDYDKFVEPETEKAPVEQVEIKENYEKVSAKTYVVKPGDTLYSLSNKFYITVEDLMQLNNLKDYNLKVGQLLVVSPE